jgi:hypothetical protein
MFPCEILKEAIDNGFTEPDPREDLKCRKKIIDFSKGIGFAK